MTTIQNAPNPIWMYNYTIQQLNRWFVQHKLTHPQRLSHLQYVAECFDRVLGSYFIEVTYSMAKKNSGKMFTTKFASISLTKEEKALAKAWIAANIADVETYWVNLGVDGWKQSSSYDEENDCWLVSLTQRQETHRNYDICVTSRADNPVEALMLCFYKITQMYPDKKLPTEQESNKWG